MNDVKHNFASRANRALYYVDTVGKYEGTIREYIQNQLQEDIAND